MATILQEGQSWYLSNELQNTLSNSTSEHIVLSFRVTVSCAILFVMIRKDV